MNQNDRKKIIESTIERFVEKKQFASIEWTVERGKEIFSRGYVDNDGSEKRTNDLIYRIYSMTKPVVSIAALKAIEMGLLRLYDPVAAYFENFKNLKVFSPSKLLEPAKSLMNIEQLLTHKSGLSYGFESACPVGNLYARAKLLHKSELTLGDFINQISQFPLAFHPGEGWRYSVSTDVLAGVLELVFGRSIDEILKELVFEPLEMDDTSYSLSTKNSERLAKIYGDANIDNPAIFQSKSNELNLADVEDFYPWEQEKVKPRGGHGLFSTTKDYNKFAQMLLTGLDKNGNPLVSKNMMNFALLNRIDREKLPLVIDNIELPGYGYNFLGRIMIDQSKALALTGKNEFGWAGAASTYFWVDADKHLTGVIMAQYLWSNLPFAAEIKSAVYQALAE